MMNMDSSRDFLRQIHRDNQLISKHVTFGDVTKCFVPNVNNFPNTLYKQNLIRLANEVYEPLIDCFGDNFTILSAFQCKEACSKMGKKMPNQYMLGEAFDLNVNENSGLNNSEIFEHIYHWLPYDVLTWRVLIDDSDLMFPVTSPIWITVTLKKLNNRYIANREHWEDGLLFTNRIYR